MGFWHPVTDVPGWDAAKFRKLSKRLRRMDVSLMLDWVDQAGSAMYRAFADYRRERALASLDEIDEALLTLWAMSQELRARKLAEHVV